MNLTSTGPSNRVTRVCHRSVVYGGWINNQYRHCEQPLPDDMAPAETIERFGGTLTKLAVLDMDDAMNALSVDALAAAQRKRIGG